MNEFQELRRYLVLSLGEDRPLFSKYCLGGEFPAFSGILKEKVYPAPLCVVFVILHLPGGRYQIRNT